MNKIIFGAVTVLLILFAGCIKVVVPDGSNSGIEIPPAQQPVAYIDAVQPTTVYVGDAVTLNGHGTDSNGVIVGYEWRSNIDGILSTAPSFTTTSLSVGTHIISFKVIDNDKLWSAEVSTAVTVNPKVAKPVIESFVASPSSVVSGGLVELSWSVSGAKTVSIDNGIGQVAAIGSKMLYPSASTVYTLTALNDSGSVNLIASVTVQESSYVGNPIIDFTANYLGGTSWQLNWKVLYATERVIEPEIGPVNPTGSAVVTVPSGQTKTYRLTATNSGGVWWAYREVILMSP